MLVMWVMLFMTGLSVVAGGSVAKHRHATVNMTNDLGNGFDLTPLTYCKSKDDDLGSHIVKPGQFYVFGFTPNFLGTTLYTCNFGWSTQTRSFKIYDYDRDNLVCRHCKWLIQTTSPCEYNYNTKAYDICTKW
ncbi:hypothetical protein SLA2020_451640 [Shorea laevis]